MKQVLSEPPPSLDVELPFVNGSLKIENWIRQLTAGLLWSVLGEYNPLLNYYDSKVFCPQYFPMDKQLELENAKSIFLESYISKAIFQCYKWNQGWSPRPKNYPREIYYFLVKLGVKNNEIFFKHVFYKNLEWYIGLKIPNDLINKIRLYI